MKNSWLLLFNSNLDPQLKITRLWLWSGSLVSFLLIIQTDHRLVKYAQENIIKALLSLIRGINQCMAVLYKGLKNTGPWSVLLEKESDV